ncbi:MAG: YncE family protein [Candidatus Rokuibacteriota bacterium]
MALRHAGYIDLPPHARPGGFDHAAIHRRTGRLYVAHTANDAIDVIDCAAGRHVASVRDLQGVAGALVSDEDDLVFASNRGENTVGVFSPSDETRVAKVSVGVRPNGLAYDSGRRRLLAANVGNPDVRGSFTVSVVDVEAKTRIADVPVSGRTRWTVFDPEAGMFHVNIADPPQIVVVEAGERIGIKRIVAVPSAGPHGLDLDVATRRLFCACDGMRLVTVHADSGDILSQVEIGGVPDVIFFNAALGRLYVAIGDPGVIEVFDTDTLRRRETVQTEKGAHTLAFDAAANAVYAFLPATHRAAVYVDGD